MILNPNPKRARRVDHHSRRNGAASAATTKRVPEQTKKRKAANASAGRATTRGRASRQQLPGAQVSPEATVQPSRAKAPRTFSAPRRRTLVIRAASRSSVRRPFARASLDAMHGRCVPVPGGSARHCDELRRPRTAAWPANRRRDGGASSHTNPPPRVPVPHVTGPHDWVLQPHVRHRRPRGSRRNRA
jgi:hypothetical protein